MFERSKNLKLILYDEYEMRLFGGYLSEIRGNAPEPLLETKTIDDYSYVTLRRPETYEITMVMEQKSQIIELDPTTMKRIAKYNLEKENEELLKEIKQNEEKIKSLKTQYEELKTRLKTISDIGSDIWENGAEYEKEYDDYD